jgi:hypothetical protein
MSINEARTWPRISITCREFKQLDEYSASVPTGVYVGKRWRHEVGAFDHKWKAEGGKPFWIIREYIECDPPEKDMVMIAGFLPVFRVKMGKL